MSSWLAYTLATMLLITHALAGATVATQIRNPLVFIPLNFGLHFLMDYIPHWDLGTDFKKRSKIASFFLALLDGFSALLVVFFLFQYRQPLSLFSWLGAGANLLPDLLEAPSLFLGFQLVPLIDSFHDKMAHRETTTVFAGLLPQVLIISVCLYLAAKL